MALKQLAQQQLGLSIQEGQHSSVDDARAALYLYQKHAGEVVRAVLLSCCICGMSGALLCWHPFNALEARACASACCVVHPVRHCQQQRKKPCIAHKDMYMLLLSCSGVGACPEDAWRHQAAANRQPGSAQAACCAQLHLKVHC
jgi:hypothetical protein